MVLSLLRPFENNNLVSSGSPKPLFGTHYLVENSLLLVFYIIQTEDPEYILFVTLSIF